MKDWFSHILFYTDARPEAAAMVMEDRVVTYGMLRVGIERCARHIAALRLDRSDTVAVLVKNPIRHLTLSLALFRIGLRSISLEHSQSGLQQLKFAVVLDDRSGAAAINPANRLVQVSDDWFTTDPPPSDVALASPFSDSAQICRLSLTSGTTGAPKIIEHPVQEFGARLLRFIDINWHRVLCLPGISSNWAFVTSCAALATGRAVCFAETPFQAIRMIELFAIDFVMASTEQLLALTRVARTSRAQLESLRQIWFGGSVPTRVLLEAAMIYLCNNILCRYAASETGLIAQASARELLASPGLVGRIVPGVEVAIFDAAGVNCPPGKVGGIKVRADSYDGATINIRDQERWIDLGDIGWINAENNLYVLGRSADLGVMQAELSPLYEIEHILRLEWDLADAAAVMVERAPGHGEPQLWIGVVDNKDATAEKLASILRRRGLSYDIQLFDVPTIPRGANGKVNRQQLEALIRTTRDRR
jgi:acyl-coenzyme A synthetase/AMP-(fatty) acid ligase